MLWLHSTESTNASARYAGIAAGPEGLKICAIAMTLVSNGNIICLPIHMSLR
jgi:hypothetical protein